MSEALNVTKAAFGGLREVTTAPLWQYDYGQILKITGLDLPQAFEVHFSNSRKSGETVTQIGSEGQVVIPDMFLTSGADIYAFIFLHDGLTDGETEYVIKIPVRERPEPSDIEPTPEQQDAITEAIAALNDAVTQTGEDKAATAALAEAAAASSLIATEAAQSAQASATSASASATTASTAASTATTKASEAATSAASAASAKTAAETAEANAQAAQTASESAQASAESAARTATAKASEASASATSASGSSSAASASASQASGSATSAANSATAASGSATSAATSATTASTKASEASASATAAQTAQTAAEAAQTAAETAQTEAEEAAATFDDYLHSPNAVSGYLTTNGTIHADDATLCITTDYVPVNEGEEYSLFVYNTAATWTAVCFYNSSKNLVGARDTTNTDLRSFGTNRILYKLITVPADVAYMRVTTRTYGGNTYFLVPNKTRVPFFTIIKELMTGLYFGGGLIFNEQSYTSTDLDDYINIGYTHSGYSTVYTNAPAVALSNGYRLILVTDQGGLKNQIFINFTRQYVYARTYAGGAWQDWRKIIPDYNEGRNSTSNSTAYTQSDFESDLSNDTVRVMSYNVAQYDNDGTVHIGDAAQAQRLISFKKMLMYVNADIVCTQEDADYIDSADTLHPLPCLFAPLYPYKLGVGGPAMYYKKAGTVKNYSLESVTVRRGIVTVKGKSLYVYTAHLSVASSSKRQEQLQDILTNAISVDNPTYWVLCGDFNTIETADRTYLLQLASNNGYTLANGGYLGWINTHKNNVAIDNMLCSPNVIIKKFEVLGNWYDDLWSDHYPIYCDLVLKGDTADVNDVQVNGTSVVSQGVASIPLASPSAYGVTKGGRTSVSGTTPSITAQDGVQYICGEVATLDITLPDSGIVDVVFTSGSTPTVLTVTPPTGQTVRWANGFDATSLEADTVYEINILNGLGVAQTWSTS